MANEKRLIDLDRLVSVFRSRKVIEVFPDWLSMSEASHAAVIRFARIYREIILQTPIVDAVEVVHGFWDDSGRYQFPSGRKAIRCNICGCALSEGEYHRFNWNYCPVCGSKMDLEATE